MPITDAVPFHFVRGGGGGGGGAFAAAPRNHSIFLIL
jgi:hypothetical protein